MSAKYYIPRSFEELNIEVQYFRNHPDDDTKCYVSEISENTSLGFFIRHTMEVVLRALNHGPIMYWYAQLMKKFFKHHRIKKTKAEIIMIIEKILWQTPFIYLQVVEGEEPFASCSLIPPHKISLCAAIIMAARKLDPNSFEYKRNVFFWAMTIMHELAHYFPMAYQWLFEFKGDMNTNYKKYLNTPPRLNSIGEKEKSGARGEGGQWVEEKIFARGLGRIEPGDSKDGIGPLWLWDWVNMVEYMVNPQWIEDFVDLDLKNFARIYPTSGSRYLWHTKRSL